MPEVSSTQPGAAPSGAMDGKGGAASTPDLKQQGAEIGDALKERGKDMLARQKDGAAEQVESLAEALRGGASGGRDDDGARRDSARLANAAADRLESLGRQLREKDLDSLLADAEDMGRRSPGAFFAGSVVAGFLLSRFLKSSADRRSYARDDRPVRGEPERGRPTPFEEPLPATGTNETSSARGSSTPTVAPRDPATAASAERVALLGGVPTPNAHTGGSRGTRQDR